MSDNNNGAEGVHVVLAQSAKPDYQKERLGLDKLNSLEWLQVFAIGLISLCVYRTGGLLIFLLNAPAWLLLFVGSTLLVLIFAVERLKKRMPRLLASVTFGGVLGFISAFIA